MTRARLIEVTRYSPPAPVYPGTGLYDAIIQRAGSQGGKDNQYTNYHPAVMSYPVRIAYWYFGSAVGWQTQADLFLSIVGKDFQVLACDFEEGGNTLSKAMVAGAMEFCLYLQSKGYKVILYTNQSTYTDWINKYDATRAKLFDFWFAWPGGDNSAAVLAAIDTYSPPTPASRPDWSLWQYRFGEHAPDGFEHDVFNGDAAALQAWAGVSIPPVTPPSGPPVVTLDTLQAEIDGILRRLQNAGIK